MLSLLCSALSICRTPFLEWKVLKSTIAVGVFARAYFGCSAIGVVNWIFETMQSRNVVSLGASFLKTYVGSSRSTCAGSEVTALWSRATQAQEDLPPNSVFENLGRQHLGFGTTKQ